MPDQEDLETRLRSYLARGAARPAPSDLEQRILAERPVSRTRWVPQVLAAAALLLFAIGLGIALRNARSQPAVLPVVSPSVKPSLSATASPNATPTPGFLALSSIHMTTATTGWATGDTDNRVNGPNSGVFRTTDGGTHWNAVTPNNQQWIDIFSEAPGPSANLSPRPKISFEISTFFLDADRVWVAGIVRTTTDSTVTVFSTSDGGAHWQAGIPFRAMQSAGTLLDFIDNRHGWLLLGIHEGMQQERAALYQTTDGSHWSLVTQTSLGCFVNGLTFIDASTGWMGLSCDETGPALQITHDAGRTWQRQSLPFPPPSVESCGCDSFAPVLLSARDGFIPTNGPIMFVTSDAGRTWSLRRLPARAAYQDFVDAAHGWAVDQQTGTVYSTSDGGRSWNPVSTIPNTTNVPILDFVDKSTGYLLRGPGKSPLLKTTDGGRTWTEIQITL